MKINNIEPKHITEWDYLGWKEWENVKDLGSPQTDWNMTLITKFNYVSKLIHEQTFRGGANQIIAHPDMELLFETMVYYDSDNKSFMHRYNVIYDQTIPLDEIHLRYDYKEKGRLPDDFILIPIEGENEISNGVKEISLKLYKISENEEIVNDFISNTMGLIKIENYG